MYHEINEAAAKTAHEMNSFREFKQGKATDEYRSQVNEAVSIAEEQKRRVDSMYHEKIDRLVAAYSRKLADWYNGHFAIEQRCPSMMIAGGGNFPTRKKEKQNAARDRHMEEYQHIQGLLDKIKGVGMGGISSDDKDAVAKLEEKLEGLVNSQERMKAVNAYYRKHKTLDGCDLLPADTIMQIKANMSRDWRTDPKPFEGFTLSNNSANIRRIKGRIAELKKRGENPAPEGWEFNGGRVVMNKEENRVQILFDGKPEADIRAELKRWGFRWAPSQGAWQRQLNGNGLYAVKQIKAIQPVT